MLSLFIVLTGCEEDFLRYENISLNFAVTYPKTWEVQESNGRVSFVLPVEEKLPLYPDSIDIFSFPIGVDFDLISFAKQTQDEILKIYVDAEIDSTLSNYIGWSIGGVYQSEYIRYHYMDGDVRYNVISVLTKVKETPESPSYQTVRMMTLMAQERYFDDYAVPFQSMVKGYETLKW